MASTQIDPASADSQVHCRVCGETKALDEFYPRQVRACKTVGECKDCTRARVIKNRERHADYYQAYDRMRYRLDDGRKEAARKSANSQAGVAARARAALRTREENPEKNVARNALNNALRDGKIVRADGCFFCGNSDRLHAHHEDYSHPLDVVWLCPSCHGKLHTIKGDFRRGVRAAR